MKQEKTVIGCHRLNIALSIIGMLVIIVGNLITDLAIQKACYLSGGICMLISASLERQLFFTVLQLIITIGALTAFIPLLPAVKAAIPLVCSVIAIFYLANKGLLKDRLSILGCVGLIVLAMGYAITHPVVYWIGAMILTVYSFIAYRRGVTIALLWGILNAVFVVTASVAVYRLFIS